MTDVELIDHYGGPARLAEKLGWHERRAVQRIHNWRSRGIPAAVKLKFPNIFLFGTGIQSLDQLPAPAQEASHV